MKNIYRYLVKKLQLLFKSVFIDNSSKLSE